MMKHFFEKTIPYLKGIVIGTITYIIIILVFHPVNVVGNSMYPTYKDGQVLRYEYIHNDIDYGDVITFKLKPGIHKTYIKRVVGMPGDTLYISEGILYINGIAEDREFDAIENVGILDTPIVLGEDEYFCMGDNRNASTDCRKFGPVKEKMIKHRIPR